MQSFTEIQSTQSIQSSLSLLLNNDKTALSCSSGTAFPTAGRQPGMLCWRTDLKRLYILADQTPTWALIADLSAGASASVAELMNGALVHRRTGNDGGAIALEKPESEATLVGNLSIRLKGNQLQFLDAGSGSGFHIDLTKGVANAAQKIWHAGNHGKGSGLDADKLQGMIPGNLTDNIPVSNRKLNTGLNSELLNGQPSAFYAPVRSPVFEVSAFCPTVRAGTSNDHIATTAFVAAAIGGIDLGSRLPMSGGRLTGDLTIATGRMFLNGYGANPNASVIYLNAANDRYLYYDGGNYSMPGAELYVRGGLVWHSGNIGTPLNNPYGIYMGSNSSGNCGSFPISTGIETFRSGNTIGARTFQNNCRNCNCDCACCCFPRGSLVLMADGSRKDVAEIQAGDWVQGPTRTWEVDHLYVTKLGCGRGMYGFDDGSLSWSAEHTFWTRAKDGSQWLWSADPEAWRREVELGLLGGLRDNSTIRSGEGHEFAHVEGGWRDVVPTLLPDTDPDTALYLPIPKAGASDRLCFINGYLVSASVDQGEFDYEKFEWSEQQAAAVLKGE